MINHLLGGKLSGAWDVNCAATILLNNQYVAWPAFNMVQNTGLKQGTHAHGEAPPWKLKWEKPKAGGKFNFPKSVHENPEIKKAFLSFFNDQLGSKIKSVSDKEGRQMKKPIRASVNKVFRRFGYQITKLKVPEAANQAAPKETPKDTPSKRPDPGEYTTTDGPIEVPLQKEAYFIALDSYVKDGDKVLDVGCGIGYGLNLLSIKAKEVVGVDVDDKAIKYCQAHVYKKNPRLRELKVYDGYHLPYADSSFDVITTIDVIEHVEKYDKFIDELLRVAKRVVMFSTPNRRPEYTNPDGTPKNHWHLREWNRSELDTILKKHGAKIEWYHVNGPWEGPFTVSRTVRSDTQTLTPVLIKR